MRSSLVLPFLLLPGPLALAQTTTHRTSPAAGSTTHRSTAGTPQKAAAATAPATPAGPPCLSLPAPLSDKIPALPASAGCPKVLFTVSDRLDYLNPLADRFKTTLFSELPIVISLGYADIAQGTGEPAKPQQFYTVNYTGYLPDGTKFDASDDHDETRSGFTFPYGAHRVIAGWDLGFEGMRIGGKRRLYVPYQFGYGAAGQPPKIPPKSMLIFDMELVSQSDTPPAPPAPPTPPSPAPGSAPANPGAPAPGSPTTPPAAPGEKPVPPKPGTTTPSTAPSATPPSSNNPS
jgi:peptidylprolyl isomerase